MVTREDNFQEYYRSRDMDMSKSSFSANSKLFVDNKNSKAESMQALLNKIVFACAISKEKIAGREQEIINKQFDELAGGEETISSTLFADNVRDNYMLAYEEILLEELSSLIADAERYRAGKVNPICGTKPRIELDKGLLRAYRDKGYNMSKMTREFNSLGIEVTMPTVKARLRELEEEDRQRLEQEKAEQERKIKNVGVDSQELEAEREKYKFKYIETEKPVHLADMKYRVEM